MATAIMGTMLALSSCGDVEKEPRVSEDEPEAFLYDEDADTAEHSNQDESAGTDGKTSNVTDIEETQNPEKDGEAPSSEKDDEAVDDSPVPKYDGLTEEEFDSLPLSEQDAARDRARKKVTPAYESKILPEYRELYDYNNAVIGYIYIDGTVIDAPVLQTLADYEYYLHRDIDGNKSEPGCIILDADSEIGIGTREEGYLEDYEPTSVQLVHGHNMRNGTMFGSLLKYADKSYADSHAIIEYDSIYEKRSYEVLCAFYSQIYPEGSPDFKYYNWNQFGGEKEYDIWRSNIDKLALYERDVEAGYGDEYIVLSTCAYQVEDGRFAVVGVRRDRD